MIIIVDVFYPGKSDFLPSKKLYLLRAGFKGLNNELNKTFLKMTNEIYLEAIQLVVPEIRYKTVSIEHKGEIQLPKKFEGIKTVTFFVSTIGNKIEKRIEEYAKKEETTKAILLDAWASESIEEVNENFDKQLRNKYDNGTIRFSPGYSDIKLSENKKIVDFLQSDTVRVNPISGMLYPQKSTVCMIGWY